jgi:alkylation response protein AidB-like acyl-CoA dehydrogenase
VPTAACSTGAAWASPADNPISQAYRDGRLISIGGGADEIMLGIICKLEGTLPGKQRRLRRSGMP